MKSVAVILVVLGLVVVLSECLPKKSAEPPGIANSKGEEFAGSAACASCHEALTDHYSMTAHANTSAVATEATVMGSFFPGRNMFALNYYERVVMEKRDSGLYQQALHRNDLGESHRFDLVIGSGNAGQSYLYWKNDALFQLPVSYHGPAKSWSGSPGYNDFTINFRRPVTPRCMECHATFAKTANAANENSNRFDKTKMILGVTCESCHGPAAKHVAYHEQHPGEAKGRFVIAPGSLGRQLQLDLCGLCHSGLQKNIQPPFSFSPGDSLGQYYQVNNDTAKPENLDVHGNKFALLQSSKCYQLSPSMTCSTCHNTHENERGKTELFSARCSSCHTGPHRDIPASSDKGVNEGGVHAFSQAEITTNCVSCHMPRKSSQSLTVRLQNESVATPAILRTHRIAVYPEETANVYQYIDSLRKNR